MLCFDLLFVIVFIQFVVDLVCCMFYGEVWIVQGSCYFFVVGDDLGFVVMGGVLVQWYQVVVAVVCRFRCCSRLRLVEIGVLVVVSSLVLRKMEFVFVVKYRVWVVLFMFLCLVDRWIIVCGKVMWVIVMVCMNLNLFSGVIFCSGVFVIGIR